MTDSRGWPEGVERVSRFLREARAEARIEEFSVSTPTAEAAAQAAGCELGQIVKSLVFLCDERAILVMVPGNRRADREKIGKAARCRKIKVAGREDVVRSTGFEAGAVAPFPLPGIDTVLLDHGILSHGTVWVGAGSTSHLAVLAPSELLRLARAKAVDVVAPSA